MQGKTILGHPTGLFVLFFTEMWERFSFYGMRAILVLYLTAETTKDNPGLGWTSKEALALYGWYTMMVYFMGIFGGYIADNWLGQKKTVLLGGIFIIFGQFSLAIEGSTTFYAGLILLVSGVGLLKPNISTMVGSLYKTGDSRRDSGFTIFYIGINIGAVLAPLIVGFYGPEVNWYLGFSLAGFGMILGQLVYVFGKNHLKGVGDLLKHSEENKHLLDKPLTKIEKDRMVVMFISFLIVMFFWAAYEQAGGLMNLYARDKIDRVVFGWEIPTAFFQSLHAIYVVILGAPMAYFWVKWRDSGKEASSVFKMGVGSIIMSLGFVALMGAAYELSEGALEKAPVYWLFLSYFLHVVAELSLSPVALSFITKLAPLKYAGLMMGTYFAVVGLGNKAAGLLGEAAQDAGEMAIFTGIAVTSLGLGLLVLLFLKKLNSLAHGAEDVNPKVAFVEPE
ncbi:MAG: MFS transporter [Crocinitomicaceae bacterium]|nr:MFS transporter [Crocinitomicaceae bacterium]|tara:strand:- start:15184 stop:16533 length:1350 start_codon:yes stop_codon:yes gene_type:complete